MQCCAWDTLAGNGEDSCESCSQVFALLLGYEGIWGIDSTLMGWDGMGWWKIQWLQMYRRSLWLQSDKSSKHDCMLQHRLSHMRDTRWAQLWNLIILHNQNLFCKPGHCTSTSQLGKLPRCKWLEKCIVYAASVQRWTGFIHCVQNLLPALPKRPHFHQIIHNINQQENKEQNRSYKTLIFLVVLQRQKWNKTYKSLTGLWYETLPL